MGEFIRRRRKELGWSIDELGFRSHVPPRLIGAYERGENQPGVKKLTAILLALEIDPPWLDSGDRNTPGYRYLTIGGTPNLPAEEAALAVQ